MAQYPGQYNVGQSTFDIDPAWTNILYAPLDIKSFDQGFGYGQAAAPVTSQMLSPGFQTSVPQYAAPGNPAPEPEQSNDRQGFLHGNDGGGGGNMESIGRGTDPNSGMAISNDVNYSSPGWWGGWNPNVSALEVAKQYGPLMAKAYNNPLNTALKGMKMDVFEDKLFSDKMAQYLDDVKSPMSLKDIKAAYKDLIDQNWNANVNREATAQGLALGANPQYAGAFNASVGKGLMGAHDFAGWVSQVNDFNARNEEQLDVASVVDPRTTNWEVPVMSPVAKYMKTYGWAAPDAEVQARAEAYDPMAFESRLDAALAPYGQTWDSWAGQVKGGGVSDFGGYGSLGGYQSAVAEAVAANSDAMDAVNDLGGPNGGGNGGGGDGPGASSGASGGDNDGDSSNNGNGAHE
jgi:hypothetical protein